jgi:hypothetical protein
MIKKNTLFILGAGASKPFGYPTGLELRELIRGKTMRRTVGEALDFENEDLDCCIKEFDKFVDEFSRSSVYSIDLFLEERTEFMDVGKMTIAAHLISKEDDKKLREPAGNWYMYLYNRIISSIEDLDSNAISFITFNYDRSLEQFLFEAIRSRFNKPPKECAEKTSKIPIVHLYGKLDPLPWQDSKKGQVYSGNRNQLQRIRNAQKNIKLISDERNVDKTEEFQSAYELINKSERIRFLGFGFDETNLARLDTERMKGKSIVGTAQGLETSRRRWVEQYFKKTVTQKIFLVELDALSLLQQDLTIE